MFTNLSATIKMQLFTGEICIMDFGSYHLKIKQSACFTKCVLLFGIQLLGIKACFSELEVLKTQPGGILVFRMMI